MNILEINFRQEYELQSKGKIKEIHSVSFKEISHIFVFPSYPRSISSCLTNRSTLTNIGNLYRFGFSYGGNLSEVWISRKVCLSYERNHSLIQKNLN